MEFVLTLFSFFVVFFVVLLTDWLGVLGGFLLPMLPYRKVAAIPARFLLDGGSAFLSVLCALLIDQWTPLFDLSCNGFTARNSSASE